VEVLATNASKQKTFMIERIISKLADGFELRMSNGGHGSLIGGTHGSINAKRHADTRARCRPVKFP
jgi:hypothetical protein